MTYFDLCELGERIKTAREEKVWSQSELADKAGVSRTRVQALENARLADIGIKILLRILTALDLDLRLTQLNRGRPTLDDLRAENELEAQRLAQSSRSRSRSN